MPGNPEQPLDASVLVPEGRLMTRRNKLAVLAFLPLLGAPVLIGSTTAASAAPSTSASCVGQLGAAGEVPGGDAREIRGPGLGPVVQAMAGNSRDDCPC